MIAIKNEIYRMRYTLLKDNVRIEVWSINYDYRGKGYSYKIINDLQEKYNLPITLECWPTLLPFYYKLGFKKICEEKTEDGYYEMIKEC